MSWEKLARATFAKRKQERWVNVALGAGVLAAALFVALTLRSARPGSVTGPAVVTVADSVILGLGGSIALGAACLVAAAADPVDAPRETRSARILGALVGTVGAVALWPTVAIVIGVLVVATAGGVVAGVFGPLVALAGTVLLLAAVWAALGLAATARAQTTAGALVGVGAVALGVLWVAPLLGAFLVSFSGAYASELTRDVLIYLNPDNLAQQLVGTSATGGVPAATGDPFAALNRSSSMLVGLVLWIVVPIVVAAWLAPPAAASATPRAAASPEPEEPAP